jgi:hypothetical protein
MLTSLLLLQSGLRQHFENKLAPEAVERVSRETRATVRRKEGNMRAPYMSGFERG